VQSINRPGGKTLSCHSCGLYQNCNSPWMKVQGTGKKHILNVFEYPPFEDDKAGRMFQSKSGRLVTKTLKSLGVDILGDCYNIHALSCFPDNKYTAHSVDCCRKFVLKAIQEHQPKVVLLFGNLPLQTVIGQRWKRDLGGINKWRGWTIPDQNFQCWICPVFSPEYVERSFGEFDKITAENTVWVNDLKQIINLVV